MDLGLKGKSVLITGASKGIGKGLTLAFAQEGAQVSIIARQEEKLRNLVEEIGGERQGHAYLAMDLMEEGAPITAVQKLTVKQGSLDIVIHNLGGTLGISNPLATMDECARVWRLNVGIAMEFNRLVTSGMVKKSWGRLVHISSTSAVDHRGSMAYAAAKAYLNGYVRALGRALAPDGVVVSAVMPGGVIAEENHWVQKQNDTPELIDDFLRNRQAIGRLGTVDELAPFVLLLASELGSFANGALVPVDGGCM